MGGFDSSAEELYFQLGVPGAERGWNVVVFDGPGQLGCMRTNPALTFRPDYEVPLAAVLDAVVGPARRRRRAGGALAGQSFGSYFAARSAATDLRVGALVANPPVVDMGRYMEAWVGTDVYRMIRDIRPEDVTGVPEDLMPRQMQWGIEAICTRFGVPSFHAWRDAMESYRLGDLTGAISCPVLALVGEREGDEPRAQFDALVAGVDRSGDLAGVPPVRRGLGPLPVGQPAAVGPGDLRLAGRRARRERLTGGAGTRAGGGHAADRTTAQSGGWPGPRSARPPRHRRRSRARPPGR